MSGNCQSLWAAFESVTKTRAEAPALLFADETVSFEALYDDAVRWSSFLAEAGVRSGEIVALQMPKRRETYGLWLGCLRLGAPYTFIDPANPENRTQNILSRLRPRLLATFGDTENAFGAILRLDASAQGRDFIGKRLASRVSAADAAATDPAYVMFTSGSTGEPKGAIIPQRGVLSLRRWAGTLVDWSRPHVFAAINPLHFDNSVFDLYGGLLNGAALAPIETYGAPNPARWVRRLRDAKADFIFAVPTLFQTFDQLGLLTPEKLPSVETFMFGGEGFPVGSLRAFHKRFDGRARLINVYGPTETSCICSSIDITAAHLDEIDSGFASLGRMHDDFDYAVLDEGEAPVADGDLGELWIGGPNVGHGYLGAPEESARRFRQDPRQSDERSIWYRTGDLVREDEQRRLWFAGRADNQVKIRGHRIELEEIDLALERIPGVTRALTVAVNGADGAELRARFVADAKIPQDDVARAFATLPKYMHPVEAVQVDALPTNANGKVDRKALKASLQKAGE